MERIATYVDHAEKGQTNPLFVLKLLRETEKEIKRAIKQIMPLCIEEVENNGGEIEAYGSTFVKEKGKRSYEYDHIPEYIEKYTDLKNLQDDLKLRAMSGETGALPVDEETGEILPHAIIKYGSDIVKVGGSRK